MELDWNQIVMRGKSGIGVSEDEALAITDLRETDELIAMLEGSGGRLAPTTRATRSTPAASRTPSRVGVQSVHDVPVGALLD